MRTLWGAVERGALEVLFSAVTLAEVLIKPEDDNPPRPWPDPHESDQIFDSEGLTLVQVDRVIGERSRNIRRRFNLGTADAIHLACSIEHNVDALVTRDAGDLLKLPQQRRKDGQPLAILSPADSLGGPLFRTGAGLG